MVMATSKPTSPPTRPVKNMTREEAETVTKQIKENFNSLGNMLLAAREQKAYKVLGYRSFESYCQSEFGKSSSTAYQAIEDAKVRSQLEAHISENYGENVTLNFPSSHLRPLKAIEGLDNKLKAIEYAKKLAENEGKKATKQHLEIAIFEISGKRSEDFRSAIHKLGFTQGTPVEIQSHIKKERGIVKKIDKLGKIHVELYYGDNKAKEYDATQLRILTNEEKPTNPLEGSVASKGDRVLIYAQGLEGKKGTIYTWKEGKQTLVIVDGQNSPNSIAYAEMELLKPERKDTNWEADLSWDTGKQTYYYFQTEDKIYSRQWPAGLSLTPYSHELNPIDFMADWEDKFAGSLLETLANPTNLKTLVLAQAIELPEEKGREFAADLIASLNQLFPQTSKPPKAMGLSFSRTINELISGKKNQTRRAWQDDYAKNFIRYFDENIAIPALNKSRHRGGHELGFIKLTKRPYQQYLSEMTAFDLEQEGGMVATTQEFIDNYFEGQDKLVWVLHFEFLATPNTSITDTLVVENQRLREQLTEAEAAIQAIVNAASSPSPLAESEAIEFLLEKTPETSSLGETATHSDILVEKTPETSAPGDTAAQSDFLIGNTSEISAPGDTAAQSDFLVENTAKSQEIEFPASHPEPWEVIEPEIGLLVRVPGSLEILTVQEIGKTSIKCKAPDGTSEWIDPRSLRVIPDQPLVEEFLKVRASKTTEELSEELLDRVAIERKKILNRIKALQITKEKETSKKDSKKLAKDIKGLEYTLSTLNRLEEFKLNSTICHKRQPLILGKVMGVAFSQGGMPSIWVKYFKDGELEKTATPETSIEMLTILDL